jgi:hypothetical protein
LLSAAGVEPKKNKLRGAGNVAGPNSRAGAAGMGKASGGQLTAGNGGLGVVGTVSLKHVFEIARIKHSEERLGGLSLEGVARSVVAQAGSMGVVVVPWFEDQRVNWKKRKQAEGRRRRNERRERTGREEVHIEQNEVRFSATERAW